jgi:hypothetical protein
MIWFTGVIALTVFPSLWTYAKKNQLDIHPLAADGVGGCAAIGELATSLSLTLTCGLILSGAWMITYGTDNLQTFIAVPLYGVALIGVFFLPLASVHGAMKRAKERERTRLAQFFQDEYAALLEPPAGTAPDGHAEEREPRVTILQRITCVEMLYRRIDAMPVWPFDAGNVRRFFGAVLIPQVIWVIQTAKGDSITRWFERMTGAGR